MPQDKALMEWVVSNEPEIKKWVKGRKSLLGKIDGEQRTWDDLMRDSRSGEIKVKRIPKWLWKPYWRWKGRPEGSTASAPGGWYQPDTKTINIQKNEYGEKAAFPHEIMHYFAGHGGEVKPNWYIQKDMELGGWLPSLHAGGRRPTFKGDMAKGKFGEWWNKNMATKSVKYSNKIDKAEDKQRYHPWLDEHSFDVAAKFGSKSSKTGRNNFSQQVKKSFGETFKSARKSGMKVFDWKGKKFHTKYKEEM